MLPSYDVVVVGAGHAGCEAAAAAANLGSSVLLVTMNMATIGQMSCNPAMGGIAKGQIVREIDALGGYSGIVTDRSTLQFRMLNRSKGPAMWSPRAQNDRMRFAETWRLMLEQNPNVHFWQDTVTEILVERDELVGVKTASGQTISCKTAVVTSGTFLNGTIHIGEKRYGGGRAGERAAHGLTESLLALGFESGRMKTGTPPRVDGRSLDYSKMIEQPGDENPERFSFLPGPRLQKQLPCYIAYTSTQVHDILRTGFDRSPMFSGRISGTGPRYCPSIEDKIERFSDRDRHQLFVEPEGWHTVETYINGFSTSLPEEVQFAALRMIPGFENARIFRPGYAIEYDYFPPTQLTSTLETKPIKGLFFAGQINGTTGYEEAACQGLMAGINAHRKHTEQAPFTLGRSEAYIGVLIDDLINKGTNEPYRMFTSRAEHRILLRQDNADERLTPKGYALGLASVDRMHRLEEKRQIAAELTTRFRETSLQPELCNETLAAAGSAPLRQAVKASTVLMRPEIHAHHLAPWVFHDLADSASNSDFFNEALSAYEIAAKYAAYIERESEFADKLERLDDLFLKPDFNYRALEALSAEAREKLSKHKPQTLGQASRISGVSPADVAIIMVHLGR